MAMKQFSEVYSHLRRANKKQYALLAGCCFFSVLLITAYVCMMRSTTILNVLTEGGDSRKQVMMIFVLAVIGCGAFTTYAAGLFFRQKSRETGIFLALGAKRGQLKKELMRELALLALVSCGAGALLGGPLAWGLWQIFRVLVVDTEQMSLTWGAVPYGRQTSWISSRKPGSRSQSGMCPAGAALWALGCWPPGASWAI